MSLRGLFRLKWQGPPLKWVQCDNCAGKGFMTLKVDVHRHTSRLVPADRFDANTEACPVCGGWKRVPGSRSAEGDQGI